MSSGPIDGDATNRIEREDSANPFNPPKSMSSHQANDPNSLFHSEDPNRDPNRIRPLNFFPNTNTQPTRLDANAPLAPAFEYAARATHATDNAAPAPAADDEVTPPLVPNQLTIGLRDGDNEMFFKVKPTIKMKRIMDQYAERSGRARPVSRFIIDGERIQDDDTPESLDIEDGDVVEVHSEQLGGYRRMVGEMVVHNKAAATPPPVNHLTITLKEGNYLVDFKLNSITKMERLLNEYANRTGRTRPALSFLFEGQSIRNNDTPASLGMKDGDSIEVHSEQTGRISRMRGPKISISFRGSNDQLFFIVSSGIQMKHVIDKYVEHSGKSRRTLRFLFEGVTVYDNNTPESLQMNDGDVVDVHLEEIRGLSSKLCSLVVE